MHKLAKSTARKTVSGEVMIPDKLYFRIGEVARLAGAIRSVANRAPVAETAIG